GWDTPTVGLSKRVADPEYRGGAWGDYRRRALARGGTDCQRRGRSYRAGVGWGYQSAKVQFHRPHRYDLQRRIFTGWQIDPHGQRRPHGEVMERCERRCDHDLYWAFWRGARCGIFSRRRFRANGWRRWDAPPVGD